MLLNQSQLYESLHQIDNIQDDEINHFISTLQQKWKDSNNMIDVGKMDLRDIQAKLEVFVGGSDGQGQGEKGKMESNEDEVEMGEMKVKVGENMVDCEQIEKESDNCCKICQHQFSQLIPPLPKYTCTRCQKQFCEACLGRFVPNPSCKLLNDTNQSSVQEQTHTQSVPMCQNCDREHLRRLMQADNQRFMDFGKRVVNRIRNWNLELDLEICYERNSRKSDMDLKATSDSNPQHKLKNKLSSLILLNSSLKTQLSQTQSLLTYGHKINKQLTQKQLSLQRRLTQSISEFPNKIRPPCPYESERAESQLELPKDSAYYSILEDQSKLVSNRRVCCVGCTVM